MRGAIAWHAHTRTNIVIDDHLMKQAMRASGAKTKRDAVEHALRLLVRTAEQQRLLRSTRDKLHWEGDLSEIRQDSPQRGEKN